MEEESACIPVKLKLSSSHTIASAPKMFSTQEVQPKLNTEPNRSPHEHQESSKSPDNQTYLQKSDETRNEITDKFSLQSDYRINRSNQTLMYYVILCVMTLAAFATRLYKIDTPPWICWDETHFGKMGSWYINRSFFFDVHPPLGKMLIGLAGYLTGYDGKFPFNKPGDEYGDTHYVGMRIFCATLGAALVPLTYMSTWLLCKCVTAALFASLFVLFETGVNTLSRHILLDPILMFFIMAATYTLLKSLSLQDRSFSLSWWFWMCCTGVFLACSIGFITMSPPVSILCGFLYLSIRSSIHDVIMDKGVCVKFVGLFVILLAGYSTVEDLWKLLGNQTCSMQQIVKHFVARSICLIGVPVICYMVIFAIHFMVLSQSGNGDGFYSSQFQSQLEGNRLHNISMPDKLAFGSLFSLKQRRTGGGYLHSHWHLYPEEHPPQQQQVTTYSHKDENNMWMLKPALDESDLHKQPVLVRNGDLVRLEHVMTRRNLHSHREPAPLTTRHFQVSGYGQDGHGDANDIWQIIIPGAEDRVPVLVIRSQIKLIHYHVRCALQSHDKKLPKWGWDQLEVTCNPNARDPKTLWSVEEVRDDRLANVSFEVYSPSFLEMFIESHVVMTQGNSGLKPKEGEVTSRPWEWPINLRGQMFSGKEHRIYLLGNPVIFYELLVLMVLFLLLFCVHSVKLQRGIKMSLHIINISAVTFRACWWLMIGWCLHYLPFWSMTRVLYFHHYFPAFLYSAMLGGVIIDYIISCICHMVPAHMSMAVFHISMGSVLSVTAYSFYLFHPLTYGMSGLYSHEEGSIMYGLKWLDSWEF